MQNLHSTAAHQHLANVVSAWNGSCARKPPRKIADLIEKEGTRKKKEKKKKWLPVLENWMDSCSYRLSLLACVTSVLSVCVTSVYMRVLGCPTVSVAKIVFGVAMYWCHSLPLPPPFFVVFFWSDLADDGFYWMAMHRLPLPCDAGWGVCHSGACGSHALHSLPSCVHWSYLTTLLDFYFLQPCLHYDESACVMCARQHKRQR